jgi:hypothetical protein
MSLIFIWGSSLTCLDLLQLLHRRYLRSSLTERTNVRLPCLRSCLPFPQRKSCGWNLLPGMTVPVPQRRSAVFSRRSAIFLSAEPGQNPAQSDTVPFCRTMPTVIGNPQSTPKGTLPCNPSACQRLFSHSAMKVWRFILACYLYNGCRNGNRMLPGLAVANTLKLAAAAKEETS